MNGLTGFERRMLAILIVKYQAQHNLRQTHVERTKMLEIAAELLEPMFDEMILKYAGSLREDLKRNGLTF